MADDRHRVRKVVRNDRLRTAVFQALDEGAVIVWKRKGFVLRGPYGTAMVHSSPNTVGHGERATIAAVRRTVTAPKASGVGGRGEDERDG